MRKSIPRRVGERFPATVRIAANPIVALAARYAVPATYELREFVADGGLSSYGKIVALRALGLSLAQVWREC